jgi:hypothetical protein
MRIPKIARIRSLYLRYRPETNDYYSDSEDVAFSWNFHGKLTVINRAIGGGKQHAKSWDKEYADHALVAVKPKDWGGYPEVVKGMKRRKEQWHELGLGDNFSITVLKSVTVRSNVSGVEQKYESYNRYGLHVDFSDKAINISQDLNMPGSTKNPVAHLYGHSIVEMEYEIAEN